MNTFLRSAVAGASTGLLGKQSAPNQIGYDAMLILTPLDAKFDNKADALDESKWIANINQADGSRYKVLPIAYELESSPEEDVYATSSLGAQAFVREGKDTIKYQVLVTPFVMTQLRTLNGSNFKAFIVTSGGFIKGTSAGDAFEGFTIQHLRVEKELKATGDAPAVMPVSITFGDAGEWADNGAFIEPIKDGLNGGWNPLDIADVKAIIPVSVSNVAATGLTVKMAGYDGVAFEDAAIGDFLLKDSSGTVIAVTSVTENAGLAGEYELEATMAPGAHTIGMSHVGSTASLGYAGLEGDTMEFTVS